MNGLEPVLELALYRPSVLAFCFFASAALSTAVAAVAASGRTGDADPAARRAFALNVAFVVLVLLGVGARHASGSDEQATAALRLGMAALCGLGPATFEFVARLVGRRARVARAVAWGSALVLAPLAALTSEVAASATISDGREVLRGGPLLPVLLAALLVEVGGALLLAWWRARTAESPLLRRQLHAVIAAYGVGFLGAADMLRLMGVPLPPTSFIFLTASALILGHAFRSFHLLGTPDLGWRALAWLCTSALAATTVVLVLVGTGGWSGWTRPFSAALALEGIYLLGRAYARRVQPAIDDLFLRRRLDLERDLDELGETLLVVRELPGLAEEVARFLGGTLYARPALFAVRDDLGVWRAIYPDREAGPLPQDDDPFVVELAVGREVWTRDRALVGGDAARRFFEKTGAEAVVALTGPGPILGLLAVAQRRDRAPFVPVEIELLGRLAPVIAASLASARLYDRRQALRRELEDRVAARAHELARAREALERAQVDIVRREKMATVGLVVGGVATDLEEAVLAASRGVTVLEADLAQCEAAAARVLERRPELGTPELAHARHDVNPLVAAVSEGARRARVIASNLTLFARPPGGTGRVDVTREIEAALTLLEPDLQGRIVVTRELEADLPAVEGDAGAIGQVLLNLLMNAAQAIEGSGTILVRARAIDRGNTGTRIEVAVRDSGNGIPAEHLASIFEPFFTTKVAGTRGGSGLGLFVSHGIVQRHGGELVVDSEVGRGSEFRVVLPVMSRSQ